MHQPEAQEHILTPHLHSASCSSTWGSAVPKSSETSGMGARISCVGTWQTNLGPASSSSGSGEQRDWEASARWAEGGGPSSARAPAQGRTHLKPWLEHSQRWVGADLRTRRFPAQLGAAFQPQASLTCLGLSGARLPPASPGAGVSHTAAPQPQSRESQPGPEGIWTCRRAVGVQQPLGKSHG